MTCGIDRKYHAYSLTVLVPVLDIVICLCVVGIRLVGSVLCAGCGLSGLIL